MLTDFLAEFSSSIDEEAPLIWTLSMDGTSNIKSSGVGIILEGPKNLLIEHSLKFGFRLVIMRQKTMISPPT